MRLAVIYGGELCLAPKYVAFNKPDIFVILHQHSLPCIVDLEGDNLLRWFISISIDLTVYMQVFYMNKRWVISHEVRFNIMFCQNLWTFTSYNSLAQQEIMKTASECHFVTLLHSYALWDHVQCRSMERNISVGITTCVCVCMSVQCMYGGGVWILTGSFIFLPGLVLAPLLHLRLIYKL